MVTWLIGDLLTGRRTKTLKPLAGAWSEVLNDAGEVSCTLSLKDPATRRMELRENAAPGKTYLAAVDGSTVLQAGPIWEHSWDETAQQLTLNGLGMWSYFDHRVLLPLLAGRLPSNVSTDTNIVSSLQGIARAWVAQAQTWTNGQVPVVLPDEIPGDQQRNESGANLAFIGERLTQLTQVLGGPDIMFTPRFNTDGTGIEWVMRIGTPTQPLLFSPRELTFNVGLKKSSVSGLTVHVDGTVLGSQGYAAGGRQSDEVLITVSTDPLLLEAGFPLLDLVDTSHGTVERPETLQGYSDELVLRGQRPVQTWGFSHEATSHPYQGSFNVGDFARVKVRGSAYIPDDPEGYRMRILKRSGDATGKRVRLEFQPEVL